MKKLILSIVAILIAFALFSCNKENLVTNPGSGEINLPKSRPPVSTPANPAITYRSSISTGSGRNKSVYQTIAVMDTNGTNQTNVFTANTTTARLSHPTWSPDGSSISWLSQDNGYSGPSHIVAADITINSNGVPVASNYRTIASIPGTAPEYYWIYDQSWCSLPTTGKIAFIVTYGTGTSGWSFLYTVSTSGGEWDLLASVYDDEGGFYSSPCWSPDDYRIALIHHTSA